MRVCLLLAWQQFARRVSTPPLRAHLGACQALQRRLATSGLSGDDAEEPEAPSQRAASERALSRAVRMVASRSKTVAEVRLKLEEEEHGAEAVRLALGRLLELQLVDDAQFARSFAAMKWRTSQWGAARVRQALAQRRVSPADAEAALSQLFGPGGDAHAAEEESGAERLLLGAARKQWSLSRGVSEEGRVRRLTGWLSRRGHDWRTVNHIVRALQREQQDALRQAEEEGT